MQRDETHEALVLRVRPMGVSDREAWFLTAGAGLCRAAVYGGPKSRLRSHVSPFHSGRLWLYRNPVKDSIKVTDFAVDCWRPGLRDLYERTLAADAAAETVLASHGGGGAGEEALRLACGALDALESADEALCERLLTWFLWRWALLLGAAPPLDGCISCGAVLGDKAWCNGEGLLCASCAGAPGSEARGAFPVGLGARRWLAAVSGLDGARTKRCGMDAPSASQARALVTAVLARVIGRRLNTWDLV
ncbi:MAG: DNA repair protein RecO C-terminal domain-containing protein [Treponema sp.]|jgi:DNA repair protein RecO (recombination protein O)|nr:DNA repair protein RecO C-terminal domain-containing protein [Treponema sp.]